LTLEIRGLSSDDIWSFENAFYWFSDRTRIAKLMAHLAIYEQIVELPGDVIEFGVYKSASLIRFLTFRSILENDFSRRIIGFDAYGKFPQNLGNIDSDTDFIKEFEERGPGLTVSEVTSILNWKKFENYELVMGDVFETLPKWLAKNPHTRISLLHLDMDVYAPTKYVLDELWNRVVEGGIIVFDDYNTVEGETVAVDEFLKKHKIKLAKNHFYKIPSYVIKK
jgi:hypothetical protein